MIGTITIGRGNNTRVLERNRNRAESITLGKALCQHLGIPLNGPLKAKSRKGA